MDILAEAKKVFEVEMEGIDATKESLGESFVTIANSINECEGRVVCTGMGKSGHICNKIAATMASLGIKAYFMHPGEGLHGDLGILTSEDIVIAMSNSGETDEVLSLIPTIRTVGAKMYSIVGRKNSTLERYSEATIVLPQLSEAFLGNLVPTTSTTVTLVVGDALAVVVAKMRGFEPKDFALFHPNGLLGRKLTMKVRDLMKSGEENAVVKSGVTVKNAVFEMCKKPIGCVNIVDDNGKYIGIFTDGDLRRLMNSKGDQALSEKIDDVMCKTPLIFAPDILVVDLVEKLQNMEKMVSTVPIVENDTIIGTVCISDIAKAGLI